MHTNKKRHYVNHRQEKLLGAKNKAWKHCEKEKKETYASHRVC